MLGHLGAACLLIGSFGHFGYAVWQLMATRAAGGPADTMAAYLDRANDLQVVLIPILVLIDIGALLAIALLRARVVPAWAPWLAVAAMVADFGIQFGGVTATWPVTAIWGASTVAFGIEPKVTSGESANAVPFPSPVAPSWRWSVARPIVGNERQHLPRRHDRRRPLNARFQVAGL